MADRWSLHEGESEEPPRKRYMVARDALFMAVAEPFSAPKGERWLVQ